MMPLKQTGYKRHVAILFFMAEYSVSFLNRVVQKQQGAGKGWKVGWSWACVKWTFLLPAWEKQDVEGRKMQLGTIKQIFLHEAGEVISGLSCAKIGSCRCPMISMVAAQVRNWALSCNRLMLSWRRNQGCI